MSPAQISSDLQLQDSLADLKKMPFFTSVEGLFLQTDYWAPENQDLKSDMKPK